MLSGKDIICFSSIDWDFNWQGHQEIMSALARNGNRVLFVENTGIRLPKISDLPRIKKRIYNWWNSFRGFREIEKNLFVYSPLTIPFHYSKLIRWINTFFVSSELKKWILSMNFNNSLVWTFLPTPLTVSIINNLNAELVIYYCIADFEELSPRPKLVNNSEQELLEITDVVFVQCEEFRKRCYDHKNVHVFPFGVNISNFLGINKIAEELLELKKPIIGYIGGLHRYIDKELVKTLSEKTQGSVVLVGPIQENMAELFDCKNIHFFRQQPIRRLPEFVNGFDVGIIPYVINKYTKTSYPTKMNEYLSKGIPVVSTALPEVVSFNKKNDVIEIAESTEQFFNLMNKSIAENSPKKAEKRIKVAKENDWEKRISEMSEIILKASENKKQFSGWEKFTSTVKKKSFKILIPSLILILLFLSIFYTPLMWVLAEPLRVNNTLETADALIIFGGGLGERVNSDESFQEKLEYSIGLYKKGFAKNLVFSSNYKYFFSEAETMKLLAESKGIPKENLIVEEKGKNTYENIGAMKELAKKNNWKKVILVSSPYHLRRAVMVWKKHIPNIEVMASPAETQYYKRPGKGIRLYQIKGIMYEYAALVYYWLQGYI